MTWSSLPKKGRLAVIVLARLAKPLTERSLTSRLFYQPRSVWIYLENTIIGIQLVNFHFELPKNILRADSELRCGPGFARSPPAEAPQARGPTNCWIIHR